MNLPNAYDTANPTDWIIEKRPDHMLAPGFLYPGWTRMGGPKPNAWDVANPTQWIIEKRPDVMRQPWFAMGGNQSPAFLPRIPLRT
jgi:hypothetical protein